MVRAAGDSGFIAWADSVDADGVADAAALAAHLADTVDAHDATAVSFSPAQGLAATTVQAAIEEVVTDAAATYRLYRLPAHAGTRTGEFDPSRSIYNLNAANRLKVRGKIGKAPNNRVKIALMGHSMLAGSGSGGIGTLDVGVQLRKQLTARGFTCGTGVVFINNGTGLGPDTRYTSVDVAWTAATPTTVGPFYQTSTAAKSVVFTSDVAGTVVDVVTFGNSAAFTVSIDGGGAVAITPSGSIYTYSVTGLADTTHTVTITSVAGTNYLIGVGVRGTVGVEINNGGIGGSSASNWLASSNGAAFFNAYNASIGLSPTLAVVQLDANEAINAVSVATFTANMTTLLTALAAASIPAVLVASPSMVPGGNGYNAVTQATWDSFLSALYDLADTFDLPLVDLTDAYVSQSLANAAGMMNDQVHPNASGYHLNAFRIADALTL